MYNTLDYDEKPFNSSEVACDFEGGSLNFIRLLRVVITPSVVERRKRLEAIG